MARPAKGTAKGDQATIKWRNTMEQKYGKDWRQSKMAKIGAKGGHNGSSGGFASDVVGDDGLTGRQRASIAGAKGGRIGKRGSAKNSKKD